MYQAEAHDREGWVTSAWLVDTVELHIYRSTLHTRSHNSVGMSQVRQVSVACRGRHLPSERRGPPHEEFATLPAPAEP